MLINEFDWIKQMVGLALPYEVAYLNCPVKGSFHNLATKNLVVLIACGWFYKRH